METFASWSSYWRIALGEQLWSESAICAHPGRGCESQKGLRWRQEELRFARLQQNLRYPGSTLHDPRIEIYNNEI